MRIFGIDPGLHICGYACLDFEGGTERIVEAGFVRTQRSLSIERRLNQIAVDIKTLLEKFKPDIVAVEALYSHYAHPRTAILMGHARGVILEKCAAAGIEVKSYGATRIKKSLTGNGHASKEQMQRTIQTVMALPEMPQPADVADAMAAAICCANDMLARTWSDK